MTASGCCRGNAERVLVHYDIEETHARNRKRVNRYLFGYKIVRKRKGTTATYRYEGAVKHVGVRWVGQSVFLMIRPEAERFGEHLRRWGVRYTTLVVYL